MDLVLSTGYTSSNSACQESDQQQLATRTPTAGSPLPPDGCALRCPCTSRHLKHFFQSSVIVRTRLDLLSMSNRPQSKYVPQDISLAKPGPFWCTCAFTSHARAMGAALNRHWNTIYSCHQNHALALSQLAHHTGYPLFQEARPRLVVLPPCKQTACIKNYHSFTNALASRHGQGRVCSCRVEPHCAPSTPSTTWES